MLRVSLQTFESFEMICPHKMNGDSNISQHISAILLFFSLSALAQNVPPAASAGSTKHDYWSIEDAKEREKLPLYKIIPAAKAEELTPANGLPNRETFLTWHRSHGDNGGARYSALDQINRQNVTNLQAAWTYHSNDGRNNI